MAAADDRRARRAARTCDQIVDAAATLFAQQGMFNTTVEQVAEAADVSPATVYAVAGGKAGILSKLMDRWARSATSVDVEAILASSTSANDVLIALGRASAAIQIEHGQTMQIALATAPHDQLVREALTAATLRYRTTLSLAAARISELRQTSTSDDVSDIADTLWFFFGYGAWSTLIRDLGRPIEESQRWLVQQATKALSL